MSSFSGTTTRPVADELTEFDLPVEGAIPAELDGWYLRNGPNPRQATGALVHRRRDDPRRPDRGRARRLVPQPLGAHRELQKQDFPLYNADGTRNLRSSVANTHVVNHAGKTLALVESSLPYEITNDLETVGAYDFGGKLVDSMTAHPKICPTTGELHFFGYGNIFAPHVTYHRADANGELTINRPLDVPALTMMHDFALTAEHVVFMDLPIVFNLDIAMKGDARHALPLGRQLRRPARRAAPRRSVRRGALVRDRPVLRVPRRQRVRRWQIDRAAGGPLPRTVARTPADSTIDGVLWSWTIDLQTGRVTERQLDDRPVEFPRIDDRLAGLPARYAVSVGEERAGALRPGHRQRRRARVRHGGVAGPAG